MDGHIFPARNNIYYHLLGKEGFLGVGTDAKSNCIVIYVDNQETKDRISKHVADNMYGYFIKYNIRDELKFS